LGLVHVILVYANDLPITESLLPERVGSGDALINNATFIQPAAILAGPREQSHDNEKTSIRCR